MTESIEYVSIFYFFYW